MEEPSNQHIVRTFPLPRGGTVTVTASGEGVEALDILRPEVAVAFATRLKRLGEDLRNDSVHNVE